MLYLSKKGHNKRRCPDLIALEQTSNNATASNLTSAERAAAVDPGFARNIT